MGPSGYEVASQQIILGKTPDVAWRSGVAPAVTENDSTLSIGSVVFNKHTGLIGSIKVAGREILCPGGGPLLHLWRAPHQKDDMWAYPLWEKYGLNRLVWSVAGMTHQDNDTTVTVSVELNGEGKERFIVHHHVLYTITGKDSIKVDNDVSFSRADVPLARVGVRLLLSDDLDDFRYYGRGPMENYADRKKGADIGLYKSTIAAQLTPYEKPMECGNHEDVRWAEVNGPEHSLTVSASGGVLQVSALPYTDEELQPVEYRIDLPKPSATVLCVSARTLGVGSWGRGPKPLDKYIPMSTAQHFSYFLKLK
jgi:beta-galactosidase